LTYFWPCVQIMVNGVQTGQKHIDLFLALSTNYS